MACINRMEEDELDTSELEDDTVNAIEYYNEAEADALKDATMDEWDPDDDTLGGANASAVPMEAPMRLPRTCPRCNMPIR